MLFGFPPHQFARLCFLHAFNLNFLDDDVSSAYRGDDLLRLHAECIECLTDGVGDDAVVHHVAFNDGCVVEGGDDDLDEFRRASGVVDDHWP